MELAYNLFLTDILELFSQYLLVPVIIVLLIGVVYGLWCIGSIIMQAFTERRNFKVQMPLFLSDLTAASPGSIPGVIATSGLLRSQKACMLTLWDYRHLPPDTHVMLAKRLLANEELRYQRITGRTDTVTRLAPMFGLMGTLIPLGPGIVALGQGDTTTLSQSIGVAFNTTVCGLIVAAVCFVVSKIRRSWYENYMSALESAMTSILEIVADLRKKNAIDVDRPGTALFDWGFAKGPYRKLADIAVAETYEPGSIRLGEDGGDRLRSGSATGQGNPTDKEGSGCRGKKSRLGARGRGARRDSAHHRSPSTSFRSGQRSSANKGSRPAPSTSRDGNPSATIPLFMVPKANEEEYEQDGLPVSLGNTAAIPANEGEVK